MVMGSIFDTPTDEEDQNPPQPQQPPPQDPLAQQPVSVEPQPAQLPAFSDQDSINRAQAAVGNALQGVNTIAQLGAPPPVQGPPVPQPTGPLVNSTGLPALNTPNPDLPINQAIINQGQQAQQALAQNGPTINYQNGQPYYGPSFGDAFLQGAVGAGIGAPIFGPASAAIRTAGSMLGGSAAPAAVSALGGNPTEQRIAGTIGSLAPFTGANPWALAGGVGGSEFGQRTGLDVPLPFVGSLDTLIGAGLPGLFRGGARAASTDPLAGIQSPQSPESANFQGPTAEPLYRGNQTGQPGNWWSVSPDYAQTYGGPAQAATLGTHPLETLDITTPEGKAALLDSMNRVRPDLAAANTGYIARLGDPNFQSGMSFQPQDWPGVEQDLQNQGYRAMKLGPDWSGTVRPGENQDVYYTLDRGAVTPTTSGQPAPATPGEVPGATTTTVPTSTTTTSGAYPPRDQFASDEHQQGYYQGLLDTTQLAPHEFRPTRGPDDTDFNQGYKEARANLPPGSLVNAPYPENYISGATPPNPQAAQANADFDQMAARNQSITRPTGNEPGMAEFNAQRATGAQAGEASAPIDNNGGRPPTGGTGVGGDRGGPPISKNFGVLDYLNIPRTLMAGGDASMSLRQSIVMAFAHPQRWLQSLDAGAQAFTSDIAAKDFADQVAADPMRNSVLKDVYQAPTGRGEGTLTTREEQYASPATIPLVSKIPVVGGPISEYYRATERGTLTQLNQVRWDVSKDFAQKLLDSRGETPATATPQTLTEINRAIAPNGDRLTDPSVNSLLQLKPESQQAVTDILNQKGEDLSTVTPYTQRMIDKYVSAINEATGRGTLGSAAVEKAVLPLSQVFFSWRNAVAKPEYVAQIFSEPFTPAWNAIVKDQAAFLVGGATTLGLLNLAAKQAGVPIQIGLDPRSADFGKAVIGGAHIDIWGGFQQPARAAWQAVMAAEGKPNAVTQGGREYQKNLGDLGLTYLGNKLSPQAALAGQIALMKYGDKLPPGTLDALQEAFPTNRQPGLDLRTASQFLTPLWIQDMATAIKNDGVGVGIPAGAASFMGVGVQDYKPTASAQVANAGTQALSEPATLAKAFPDAPIMQQILKGQNYNDLLPTEKTAIKSVLDPAAVAELDAQNRKQNPAIARHSDAVDYLNQKKDAAENELLDRLNAGTMDKAHVANLLQAVRGDYFSTKAKVDADPAYKAEIAKIPAASTSAGAALDGYYQIPDKAGREQYIQWLASQNPALAARIATAVQLKNQPKLEVMYANGELR